MTVSFRQSIDFVARNFSVNENILDDSEKDIGGYQSVKLMANQFARSELEIVAAIVRYRREKIAPLAKASFALPTAVNANIAPEAKESADSAPAELDKAA